MITVKNEKPVSPSVINRLPRYYRFLGDLMARGATRVSSKELAQIMKVTASQIRQDLNCFGGFGQQGYGYNVELLHREIASILGISNQTPAVLIGAGNLGKTIANQVDLTRRGFRLIGAFDRSPDIIGKKLVGLTIQDVAQLEAFCREHHPKAAIVCVPKQAAAEMAEDLISWGIVGFWNFSSYDFSFYDDNIATVNVHLGDSIMTLSYLVTHLDQEGKQPNTLR